MSTKPTSCWMLIAPPTAGLLTVALLMGGLGASARAEQIELSAEATLTALEMDEGGLLCEAELRG